MLHSVFKDLYDQGVLIFLDTGTYVTNSCGTPELFSDKNAFLRDYTEGVITHGWIWCYTRDFNKVLKDLKEDTCHLIEYGFNSDNEQKALNVGRMLINSLNKFKFMAHWDERALKEHKVSTVVATEDLPDSVQTMVEEYETDV
jgi:hypothetical protein